MIEIATIATTLFATAHSRRDRNFDVWNAAKLVKVAISAREDVYRLERRWEHPADGQLQRLPLNVGAPGVIPAHTPSGWYAAPSSSPSGHSRRDRNFDHWNAAKLVKVAISAREDAPNW